MAGPNSWLPLPLVGRHDELTAIRHALDSAANGHTGAVVIAGGQGVGKARLLEDMLAEARDRGFVTAHGTASPADAGVPYAILADTFTPVVRTLSATELNDLARGTGAALAHVVPAIDSTVSRAPDVPNAPRGPSSPLTGFIEGFSV